MHDYTEDDLLETCWRHQCDQMHKAIRAANECPTWRYFLTPWVPLKLWTRWYTLAEGERYLWNLMTRRLP